MFSRLEPESCLHDLQVRLGRAQVVTPDLVSKVVATACVGIAAPGSATKAATIDRLIAAEAWTEAALALVELASPLWKLRRLAYEDGAWLCSISEQWNVPAWLGDSAEARHESLPLAILSALIEVQRCGEPSFRSASSVPPCGIKSGSPVETMCCDNFA